ncbi:hypothetical protein ACR56S_04145 [Staphylococcus hominis]|uniref:hypothetical protein n=1 Tax=Staphylococcus hominis TaxID=1290 RepID=UPI003D9FDD9E
MIFEKEKELYRYIEKTKLKHCLIDSEKANDLIVDFLHYTNVKEPIKLIIVSKKENMKNWRNYLKQANKNDFDVVSYITLDRLENKIKQTKNESVDSNIEKWLSNIGIDKENDKTILIVDELDELCKLEDRKFLYLIQLSRHITMNIASINKLSNYHTHAVIKSMSLNEGGLKVDFMNHYHFNNYEMMKFYEIRLEFHQANIIKDDYEKGIFADYHVDGDVIKQHEVLEHYINKHILIEKGRYDDIEFK